MSISRTIIDPGSVRRTRCPSAPGEVLRGLFLGPRGIPVSRLADAVGCSRKHMSEIVNGKVRLEPMMAARLARVLGTSAEVWLNLQNAVDIWDADKALRNWRPKATYAAA